MRYGTATMALLIMGCAAATTQQGCSLLTRGPNGEPAPIEQIAGSVAPFLPGPLGAIVLGGAGLAVGAASVFAKRKVNAAHEADGSDAAVNPVVKALAQRRYLVPLIGALPLIGSALHIADVDKWSAIGTALLSAVAVVADALEKKPAPAVEPVTPTTPPPTG